MFFLFRALGFDPRFNTTNTFWIGAGVAGIDPKVASFASVAFINYAVDGNK